MPNAALLTGLGEAARYQGASIWLTWRMDRAPAGLRRACTAIDDLEGATHILQQLGGKDLMALAR